MCIKNCKVGGRPSVDPVEHTHTNNENEVVQSDVKESGNTDEGATSSGQVKLEAEKKKWHMFKSGRSFYSFERRNLC